MKLWLISQTENMGYDTYDSAVVAALTEDAARKIHPGGNDHDRTWDSLYCDWASSPKQVKVELIGDAAPNIEAGVICASFNAG